MDGGTVGEAETADISQPASDDDDRPWAIRGMPMADRNAAKAAAKRAKKPMPIWLGEAIRAYIEQERDDDDDAHMGEIIGPGQEITTGVSVDPMPPLTIAEIGEAVRIAQIVAQLRNKELSPNAKILVNAEKILRMRLLKATRQDA